MERADQVLAERVIDTHFAADRAVDLRQQGRRNLDERNPAQKGRCGETGGVADDAAADRHDRASAIGAGTDQRLIDSGDRLQILVTLSVRDEDRLTAAQNALKFRAVKPPNHRARDDEAAPADCMLVEQYGEPL